MEEIVVKSKRYFDLTPYDGEVWDRIEGSEYEISNYGRIKHLAHEQILYKETDRRVIHHKERILSPTANKQGYYHTIISINGKLTDVRINRMVALAFVPNPNNLPFVNHKNENPGDDRCENIEWCDAVYNANYGTARKKMMNTLRENNIEKWHNICQYAKNGNLINTFLCKSDLENAGFKYVSIAKCCKHKANTAYGYVWRYDNDPFSLEYKKHRDNKQDADGRFSSVPVVKYDLDGNYIEQYNSMTDAANSIGGNTTMISYCCKGKRPTAYGYIWRELGEPAPEPYKNKNEHPVSQFTKDGKLVATYPSIKEAAKAVSDERKWTSISECCIGLSKSYLGFVWKYAKNE